MYRCGRPVERDPDLAQINDIRVIEHDHAMV